MTRKSKQSVTNKEDTRLNRTAVRAFLLEHPEMITEDPAFTRDLLQAASKQQGENIKSLAAAAIARETKNTQEYRNNYQAMVEAAQNHVTVTQQIFDATLLILRSDSLEQLIRDIQTELKALLDVEYACLATSNTAWHIFGASPLPETALEGMQAEQPVLRAAIPELANLYPKQDMIKSEAILPLSALTQAPIALIFGSSDSKRFTPDQGSDLLRFLAAITTKHLRRITAAQKTDNA